MDRISSFLQYFKPSFIWKTVKGSAAEQTFSVSPTPTTLNVALQNQTTSNNVFAYITGQALNNNNALVLLQADGKSLYYPTSPDTGGSALAVNCGIQLGKPGSTTEVTIPQIAGGRIWFCVGSPLTFLLNPGPGLVHLASLPCPFRILFDGMI
jgi:hypothetical protein